MKIVFIHGSGSYGGMWRYQTAHFPDSDAITLPGHPEGEVRKSAEGYADWLKEYIAEKGYKDVVLCGQSLGGSVTMMYALKYPQGLKGIIIVNSSARPTLLRDEYMAEREEAVRGNVEPWHQRMEVLFQFTPPDFKKELIERMKAMGPAIGLNDLRAFFDLDVLDRLPEIKLPALIIHGDQDRLCPVEYANQMGARLPNSKVVFIPKGTHLVFAEQPEAVNQAIEDFLGSLS